MRIFSIIYFFAILSYAQAQEVIINGSIKNNKDSTVIFIQNSLDAITGEMNFINHIAKIDSIGNFQITLPIKRITRWMLEVDNQQAFFHLSPNKNISILIDLKDGNLDFKAIGENAEYVNFHNILIDEYYKKLPKSYDKDLKQLETSEYLREQKVNAQKIQIILDNYTKNTDFDPEFYKWLNSFYKYYPYERTLQSKLVGNPNISDSLINELLISEGLTDDYAALNIREYNILANQYAHYKFNGKKFPLDLSKMASYISESNILTGKTKEVLLTNAIYHYRMLDNEKYNYMKTLFENNVSDQTLIDFAKTSRQNYQSSKSASEKVIIDQKLSLSEIFNTYKGKIIYVDFWASWCGPCKIEMPNSAKLKKKINNDNVVFLYLGYNDRKVDWLKAKEELNIQGEHYLLTDGMIKEASRLFNIRGIPHYAIIDKEGNIIEKNAKRPDRVYNDLIKAMNAYP